MAVVLECENVFLREVLLNDVEPLAALLGTPGAVSEPLGETPRAFIAVQQETYQSSGLGVYAAVHKEAGVVVGYAGLRPVAADEPSSELWCLIDPTYRGGGLGKEIARALVDHAFGKLGHQRVTASVSPNDGLSSRFLEGLGFALENEPDGSGRRVYAISRAST